MKEDQLDPAIVELRKLQVQVQVANVFGQEAANRQAVPQIQNLIAALKTQGPSLPPYPQSNNLTADNRSKHS